MFRRYCDPKIVEGIRGHFFAGRVLFPINHTVITVKQRNFEALDIVTISTIQLIPFSLETRPFL